VSVIERYAVKKIPDHLDEKNREVI